MERSVISIRPPKPSEVSNHTISDVSTRISTPNPFIEANTKTVSLSFLNSDCIIPVFAKDNEKTIAHQEFISGAIDSISKAFKNESINEPEIRVSHQIKGRVPSAIHKSVNELTEQDKTQYFERMAFIVRVPSISAKVNGNALPLTLGGVRAYNQENLHGRKNMEKFKFFIGFQNMVCCNLCVSSDGLSPSLMASDISGLKSEISKVIEQFNPERFLQQLQSLQSLQITEKQFAQLVGKSRLYNHLPMNIKDQIPVLKFNDGQMNVIAKDYYSSDSFCRSKDGSINLWNLYNLFTSAGKSSYIDSFLDRNSNAFDFTKSIANSLSKDASSHWFLN